MLPCVKEMLLFVFTQKKKGVHSNADHPWLYGEGGNDAHSVCFPALLFVDECTEMMGATLPEEQGAAMLQEEVLNMRVAKWGFGDLNSV